MIGRRLLDGAALLKATRSVASKYIALQEHRFDTYSKTSSLAKTIKGQTDRVTLTLRAASALNQRFNSPITPDSSRGRKTKDDGEEYLGFIENDVRNLDRQVKKETILKSEHSYGGVKKEIVTPTTRNAGAEAEHLETDPRSPLNGNNKPSQQKNGHTGLQPPGQNKERSTESRPYLIQDTRVQGSAFNNNRGPQALGQDEAIEHDYPDIFHSPRVAKLLGRKGRPNENSQVLENNVFQQSFVTPHESSTASDQNSKLDQGKEASNTVTDQLKEDSSRSLASQDGAEVDLVADIAEGNARVPEKLEVSDEQSQSMNAPYQMRESRVPSSRFGRLWQYGGLASSMAFGAVGEGLRRATGMRDGDGSSLILSAGNMDRLVAKLSRMRGAALKLGQMMSFQDSKMLPAPIQQVLQRVQDSADYMPASQRNKVLASNLGSDWRDLFETFDEMPMAAASIGQVHGAVLKSSRQRVAVKVQYPGVANSIDSDLNNLSILLTASRLLPKGLFLDKTIANARTELAWECDYIREAQACRKFQELLRNSKDIFTVPRIIDEASGLHVLTMERMEGIGVTKAQDMTQDEKDWIGSQILNLCLREMIEFKYMQTDPNWTNFLYNPSTRKLELLDFGASRDYPDKFIDPYIKLLLAASRSNRESCRDISIQLGYLTGNESPIMLEAHISSILTLAEPFRDDSAEIYDFQNQTITDRVKASIPVMIRERLSPPPEETYSLHRKLSGAFLLCARLGSRVRCREMFAVAMNKSGIERAATNTDR